MEHSTLNMGEIIRDLRKARALTQDALAQAAGVSVQAVSKWETGQSLPDVTLLPSIADFFGVTLDSLFGRTESVNEETDFPSPFEDDGKLHIVQYLGSRLMAAEECTGSKAIRLCFDHFEGPLQVEVHGSTRIDGSANCALNSMADVLVEGDVNGAATAGGDFICKGSLNGAATAGGSVRAEGGGATIDLKGSFSGLKEGLSSLASSLNGFSGIFGGKRTGNTTGARMKAFFSGELPDDDVIRVVQLQGRRVMSAAESAGQNAIRLSVEHVTAPINVEICGSAEIRGDIHGNATAGDSLSCGAVGGNATAGDAMNCGAVSGNAQAGDAMNCGTVGGNATAGDSITCGAVGGNVRAGDSVRITGDVSGDVTAKDGVTCGNIGGSVKADTVRCSSMSNPRSVKNPEASVQDAPELSGFGWKDSALHVVQVMNGKVLSAQEAGQPVQLCLDDADGITLHIHGNAAIDGDVSGDVHANGSVTCEGVEGNVSAGGAVSCGGVEGSVHAGGRVDCGGVEGNVSAGGTVSCGGVEGNVSAGGTVSCGDVEGDVTAGMSVTCGSIEGSVTVKGTSDKCSVTCEGIEGDLTVTNATVDCGCGSICGNVEARSDSPANTSVACEGVEGDVTVTNATVDCGMGSISGNVEAHCDAENSCIVTCESIGGNLKTYGPLTFNGNPFGN